MRKWAGYNKWKNYLLVIQLFSMFCDDIQDMDLTRTLAAPYGPGCGTHFNIIC